ncbi:hypothetical protein HMPREF9005_0436 [Actinomyces sp. oral taxon 178 str. F0338]|nr:hypothetical protein HMPREF9005_0436 [Actinomyces sp. oral taxon 178 str. F0338]
MVPGAGKRVNEAVGERPADLVPVDRGGKRGPPLTAHVNPRQHRIGFPRPHDPEPRQRQSRPPALGWGPGLRERVHLPADRIRVLARPLVQNDHNPVDPLSERGEPRPHPLTQAAIAVRVQVRAIDLGAVQRREPRAPAPDRQPADEGPIIDGRIAPQLEHALPHTHPERTPQPWHHTRAAPERRLHISGRHRTRTINVKAHNIRHHGPPRSLLRPCFILFGVDGGGEEGVDGVPEVDAALWVRPGVP